MNFPSFLGHLPPHLPHLPQVTPFGISVVALVIALGSPVVTLLIGIRSTRLARQANASKILIDLFEEHREPHLADARHYIQNRLPRYDEQTLRTEGLACLPDDEKRNLVRDLMWLYDHIGLLVAYRYVELEPVAAYLGGSVVDTWAKVKPLVEGERSKRTAANTSHPDRWQEYFEALADELAKVQPGSAKDLFNRRRRRLSCRR